MSNNCFHIISLTNNQLLIVSKSWERPEFYIEQIEAALTGFSNISSIYFDFLIKNGLKDRFYKATLFNKKIIPSSFIRAKVDDEIQSKSNEFFAKNIDLIEGSYLTNAQKFLLKKRLPSIS